MTPKAVYKEYQLWVTGVFQPGEVAYQSTVLLLSKTQHVHTVSRDSQGVLSRGSPHHCKSKHVGRLSGRELLPERLSRRDYTDFKRIVNRVLTSSAVDNGIGTIDRDAVLCDCQSMIAVESGQC